jgi:starch-binding outer membrane protein, SusD/RagB family
MSWEFLLTFKIMSMSTKILSIIACLFFLSGCVNLDLDPTSEASSGNWYQNESQFEMSLAELYRRNYWYVDNYYYGDDMGTDDFSSRAYSYPQSAGTLSGTSSLVSSLWTRMYTGVAYSNEILSNIEPAASYIPEAKRILYEAEARFMRASMYSTLISYFGDVVFYTDPLTIEQTYTLGRTSKATILQAIYADYDFAAENLPETYSDNEYYRATKGAALAMKARIALYQEDWGTARNAAKACMDLGNYSLHPDYRDLFLSSSDNTDEVIFKNPMSVELGSSWGENTPYFVTRNAGGNAVFGMSWDLFCSYLCTDGLPIDESPLFNPRDPFKNRDPRLAMTTVEFGTEWLGFIYQPHPDSLKVLNKSTGKYVTNNDSKGVTQHSVYSGLIWKKWIDGTWNDDNKADPDMFIVRYADVLLMYAEAKIELGNIDQSVLDAMNMVRARAYGVDKSQTSEYPEINITDQTRLRTILRMERRMELCFEGRRYMDLIRWKEAEIALNYAKYGWYTSMVMKKIVTDGLWPLPEIPQIDESGIPNLTPIYEKGYYSLLSDWTFDASKNYLFPIPSSEILINNNLTQNPNY